MNTTVKLLPYEAETEELNLQKSDEIKNYKNKKEMLRNTDKLDLRNPSLYEKRIGDVLNINKDLIKTVNQEKAKTKHTLLEVFWLQEEDLDAEQKAA